MPKPNKQIIIDFIISCLKNGEQRGNILVKTGKKWGTSKSAFDRYLKIAKDQYTVTQGLIKSELLEIDKQAAVEARKKAIMNADDRKEWLTKIIMKDLKVMKVGGSTQMVHEYKDKNGVIVTEIISYDHKLKALAELNKMEGDYSPTKIAQTNTLGEDVTPMIVLNQFMGAAIDIKESE